MKKILTITVFMVLVLFCFVSCGNGEHVHDYDEWEATKAATCTVEGEESRDCSCGEIQTRAISATGHSFTDWKIAKEVTCTDDGKKYRECSCGETEIQPIVSTGHVLDEARYCSGCKTDFSTQGLEFELINNGKEYEVVGIGSATDSEIYIPSKYNGKPVTSIGKRAFSHDTGDNTMITSVTILKGIVTIKDEAFVECPNLQSVIIPETVTSIIDNPFMACERLADISVHENNTVYKTIDGNLYSKDGKTFIQYAIGKTDKAFTVPNSVENIAECAFFVGANLESVVLPDTLTNIGRYAFEGCTGLTSIIIPNSVTSIAYYAFGECDDDLIIYAEASSQPSGWDSYWNIDDCEVVWGYKGN